MEDKKPDWTIGDLYSRSFEIVKKNKVLWIFGMALAVGTSSFNYRLPSSLENFGQSPGNHPTLPDQSTSIFSQVLGATNSSPFTEAIGRIFQGVPVYLYITLGLEVLFLILLAIIIGIIYQTWSSASMIQSADTALNNQKVTIAESSQTAFTRLKPVLWLNIVPGLIFTLGLVITTGLLVFVFSLPGVGPKIIGLILIIVAIFTIIYSALMLAAISIWATREAVLHNKSGQQAFSIGYKIAKKKFWSMILLGLVNNIFAGIVIWLPIVVIATLLFSGFYAKNFAQVFGPILIFFGGLFGVIFFLSFILLAGIINAFKATVWNLAYKQIKGKYES